ncbi:MAG: hypothetical protein WCI31_15680 [Prolixibacteraceae bacterium]
MKTKVKLIFAISLIAALFIGFMIGISVDYPKPKKTDLAGTFGKAEKFRKTQMTEKDLQLRSELVKDTAKLRSMIQGLVYFSLFTDQLKSSLDMCIISFKSQGMGAQPAEADKINVMKDFSDFIRNNNASLNATIVMLSGFYGKDGGDATQDVERTIQDFGSYVGNMNKKDSVLSQALVGMDNYLLNATALQARKAEFKQLKSIRDQLLIKGIQLNGLLANKQGAVTLIKYAADSQLKFGDMVSSAAVQSAELIKFVTAITPGAFYNAGSTIDAAGGHGAVAYNNISGVFYVSSTADLKSNSEGTLQICSFENTIGSMKFSTPVISSAQLAGSDLSQVLRSDVIAGMAGVVSAMNLSNAAVVGSAGLTGVLNSMEGVIGSAALLKAN